jgi:hypothetical protein
MTIYSPDVQWIDQVKQRYSQESCSQVFGQLDTHVANHRKYLCNYSTTLFNNTMKKDWFSKHVANEIIVKDGIGDDARFRINTPCLIEISENVTKYLSDEYDPRFEKGGFLIAVPQRKKGITHLTIDRVVFLPNVSGTPERSYSPDYAEYTKTLQDVFVGRIANALPIRFHTHPTHSDNAFHAMLNYQQQCNTSKQDQRVSREFPIQIDEETSLFLPDSLVLRNMTLGRMFIGFYNGLIAPVEFSKFRKERVQKNFTTIAEGVAGWTQKKPENGLWLAAGGIFLAMLVIAYPKVALNTAITLAAAGPMFVNDKNSNPQYFAQLTTGRVTIEIPNLPIQE